MGERLVGRISVDEIIYPPMREYIRRQKNISALSNLLSLNHVLRAIKESDLQAEKKSYPEICMISGYDFFIGITQQ